MSNAAGILKDKKIGIIGAGNMGRALANGLIRSGSVNASDILLSDPDAGQRKQLESSGAHLADTNRAAVDFGQVIILAVKPQIMDGVLKEIAPLLNPGHLIISIAAGIPTARMEKAINKNPVIRVMPNTPALVGKGMAAICAGTRAKQEHVEIALAILSSVGKAVIVPEAWMDAVTATSGSGPAYVYYFMESMIAAAQKLGMDSKTARTLVAETFLGAVELLRSSGQQPETLRRQVTSPGGTTEAAIRVLEDKKTRQIIAEALAAAERRGKELSGG